MGNCLVTTLKDTITDVSLLKLGEMKVSFIKATNVVVKEMVLFPTEGGIVVSVTSPGYFTDINGVSNLGNTKTLTANQNNSLYIANENCDIVISNKYKIANLSFSQRTNGASAPACYSKLNMDDLDGMSLFAFSIADGAEGDISNLNMTIRSNVSTIFINGANTGLIGNIGEIQGIENVRSLIIGNVKNLKGTTTDIAKINPTATSINLYGLTAFEGDISALANLVDLTTLNLASTNVTGNLSSLSTLTSLTSLYLNGTGVTGDTSSLANLTNLTTFTYTNTAITGTWPLV